MQLLTRKVVELRTMSSSGRCNKEVQTWLQLCEANYPPPKDHRHPKMSEGPYTRNQPAVVLDFPDNCSRGTYGITHFDYEQAALWDSLVEVMTALVLHHGYWIPQASCPGSPRLCELAPSAEHE